MTATVIYEGNLRCKATHLQSGSFFETDAPTDNRGQGARFSPTDSLCVALATCLITTMGIKAQDMGIELQGTSISVQKHMAADPRRVAKIDIRVVFPESLFLSEKDQTILERVGNNCPVTKSLHPDLVQQIEYVWPTTA